MTISHRALADRPILVTGGAGFLGSHVTEALLAAGAQVRVLDDLSTGRVGDLPLHDPNLELRIGDVHDPEVIAEAMRGMHACMHLATKPRPHRSGQDPYEVALSNILGFINVLEAAQQHRLARLVYASSDAVYGDASDAPLAEDRAPQPAGPHGMEKLVMEGYAELYARQYGLSALGLRYFTVFGAAADAQGGMLERWLERIGRRRAVVIEGSGVRTRDFLHVEDAAKATVAALAGDLEGICNVASGQRVELRALAQLIGVALGCRPMVHEAPARPDTVAHAWADVGRLRERLGFAPSLGFKARLFELAAAAQTQRGPLPPLSPPRPWPIVRRSPAPLRRQHGRLPP